MKLRLPSVPTGLLRFKGPEERTLGIDIGSSSIKAAEILHTSSQKKVLRLGAVPIARAGDSASTLRALRELVDRWGIAGTRVGISVSGPSVFVRFILLPRMTDDELKGAMRFEAEKVLPYKLEEMALDAQILDRELEGGKMRVLFVGVKRLVLDGLTAALSEVKLEPAFVDVDVFAALNLFEFCFPERLKGKGVALVHVGHKVTSLLIVHQGVPYLSRDLSVGGEDVTLAVQEGFGISEAEAAALKVAPGERAGDLEAPVRGVLERLGHELRLSFDYYESQYGRSVEEVYCSGGTSRLAGLGDLLTETVGVPVTLWEPSEKLAFAPQAATSESKAGLRDMIIALGLALRIS